MVNNQPHLAHYQTRYSRSNPVERDRHISVFEVFILESLMAVTDPLLLLWDREGREVSVAHIWSRWNIENATEDVDNFESNEAESYLGESSTIRREVLHVGVQVTVIDIKRL